MDTIRFFKPAKKMNSNNEISKDITLNINRLKVEFGNYEDLEVSNYKLGDLKCVFIHFKCMLDKESINTFSLELKYQLTENNTFKNTDDSVTYLSGI